MSTSYSVSLVVGVLAQDCMVPHEKVVKITKYNPDTGEPYQKERVECESLTFGNTKIESPFDVEEFGLSYELTGGDSYEKDEVVGMVVAATDDLSHSCDRTIKIDMEEIEETRTQVKTKLREHGIYIEPSVYMVGYVG